MWNILYNLKLNTQIQFILCGDYRQCPPVDANYNYVQFLNSNTHKFLSDFNIYELTSQ